MFKLAAAPLAALIRLSVPRAGLLGSLSAIALVLIAFLPLIEVMQHLSLGVAREFARRNIALARRRAHAGYDGDIVRRDGAGRFNRRILAGKMVSDRTARMSIVSARAARLRCQTPPVEKLPARRRGATMAKDFCNRGKVAMDREKFTATIRAFKHRAPFRPSTIVTISGNRYEVDRPDALAVKDGVALFAGPGGVPVIFDFEGVSELIRDLSGSGPRRKGRTSG